MVYDVGGGWSWMCEIAKEPDFILRMKNKKFKPEYLFKEKE